MKLGKNFSRNLTDILLVTAARRAKKFSMSRPGRRCLVYPQCSVSGYLPPDSLVKPKSVPFEVMPRVK